MACKIKFIERDFSVKNPDLADYLNEKYTELMKGIIDSGEFQRGRVISTYLRSLRFKISRFKH